MQSTDSTPGKKSNRNIAMRHYVREKDGNIKESSILRVSRGGGGDQYRDVMACVIASTEKR